MPTIIPIKELKETQKVSQLCHESTEPIFVTKNGYGDLVIMSQEVYEKDKTLSEAYIALAEAETDVANGRVKDAKDALTALRKKHGI